MGDPTTLAGGEQQFPLLQIREGELEEHQNEEENKWLQQGALEERQKWGPGGNVW